MPTLDNQQLSVTVTARSCLKMLMSLKILFKTSLDGNSVKIKDVAKLRLVLKATIM